MLVASSGWLLCIGALAAVIAMTNGTETKNPVIYHGTIEENSEEGTEVQLNAPLTNDNHDNMIGGEVCGYTIYKWHSDQPFKVVLVDRKSGAAKIVLDSGYDLDYEKKHRYNFEIAPYDCVTGVHGNRQKLHIKVIDVNDFAPVWKERSYAGSVEEGQIVDDILQVQAVDQDGTKAFSKICQYHLLTEDAPFVISENGNVRNTRPLSYDELSYYQLEVKAEDCGGLISDAVIIEIDVKPVCRARWTGVDSEVVVSGRMRHSVMPGATLDLCGAQCQLSQVSVSMEMVTSHIGKGCDRDSYALQTNRKICDASLRNLDLLPGPGKTNSWTRDLPTEGDLDSNPIFVFDGKTTAVEIPGVETGKSFGSRFTISTWMKHTKSPSESSSHPMKEQILCHSDGEGLNRHHSSLFIHNCHLVLLLRQEPLEEEDEESLKPAEWRWMLPEVCDGKWHQYTVNVNLPQVLLYVDGKLFLENGNNSEILEDWPLHSSNEVHSSRIVVGACWQGAKRRYAQYLSGHLFALTLLRNETDGDDVIQCLNSCKEKLDIVGMDEMTTGMSVSMNAEISRLTINGQSVESVERMVHNIGYINSRTSPTPGHRPITVETVVKCVDGNYIAVEPANLTVNVHEAETVVITLNATSLLAREERHVTAGQFVFQTLQIVAQPQMNDGEIQDSADVHSRYLLDSCVIQVDPRLNIEIEYLAYPENLTEKFSLEVDSSEDGLVIAGADHLDHYEEFIRRVQYINSKPQDMNSRTFVLSCTELNGHFLSNQLRVTLEVIHVVHEKVAAPHAMMVNKAAASHGSHPAASDNMRLIAKSFPTSLKYDSQETGVGVAVVMVVCVGFVIMLIVLGVMRVRSSQRSKGDGDERLGGGGGPDGNWDNTSLTITVNPMDPDNMYEEEMENSGCHDDDTESEDEDGIYSRSDLDLRQMPNYVGAPVASKSTLVL